MHLQSFIAGNGNSWSSRGEAGVREHPGAQAEQLGGQRERFVAGSTLLLVTDGTFNWVAEARSRLCPNYQCECHH